MGTRSALTQNIFQPHTSCQRLKLQLLVPSYRAFHATPRAHIISEVIAQTQISLEALHHNTGISWGYMIPMVALSVRLAVLLPLQVNSRKALQRLEDLNPILCAWGATMARRLRKNIGTIEEPPEKLEQTRMILWNQKRRELYAKSGCGIHRFWLPYLVQTPIWLILSEALREMCGASQGLLGLLTSWSSPAAYAVDGEAMQRPIIKDVELPHTVDGTLSAAAVSSEAVSTQESLGFGIAEGLEDEGFMWFTNLLLPDPHGYLSVIMSVLFITRVFSWQLLLPGNLPVISIWKVRLNRAGLLLGVAMFPLTLNVPAAMMVYWISSFSTNAAITQSLEYLKPIRRHKLPSPKKSNNGTISLNQR